MIFMQIYHFYAYFLGGSSKGSDEHYVIPLFFREIIEVPLPFRTRLLAHYTKLIEYIVKEKTQLLNINNYFVSLSWLTCMLCLYLDSVAFCVVALNVFPTARNQLLEKIVLTWHFLDAKDLMGKNILISFWWCYIIIHSSFSRLSTRWGFELATLSISSLPKIMME